MMVCSVIGAEFEGFRAFPVWLQHRDVLIAVWSFAQPLPAVLLAVAG